MKKEKENHKTKELPNTLILEEILWRLPVESLLQLKTVCKNWKSFISSSYFAKLHLSKTIHCTTHQRVILNNGAIWSLNQQGSSKLISLDDYPMSKQETSPIGIFWGSCNGLLCITPRNNVTLLWNPSTRKYKKLQDLPLEFPYVSSNFRPIGYGLGYDYSNDDYKVLAFIPSSNMAAKLYSSRTNSWTLIRDFPSKVYLMSPLGSFLHESLHWMVSMGGGNFAILSFNLHNEIYKILPLPNVDVPPFTRINVLGEQLCVCIPGENRDYEMWIMKEYGVRESWTKLSVSTRLNDYVDRFHRKWYLPLKSGEVIILLTDSNEVIFYESRGSTVRTLLLRDLVEPVTYVESLISPY